MAIKEDTKTFLSTLEGYHQLSKTLHWSAQSMSEHKLMDDIDHSILEYEDSIAEVVMGLTDSRFQNGDLKTLLPSSKDVKTMLRELKTDVKRYRDKVDFSEGITNILDDFLTDIDKWNYLRTLS